MLMICSMRFCETGFRGSACSWSSFLYWCWVLTVLRAFYSIAVWFALTGVVSGVFLTCAWCALWLVLIQLWFRIMFDWTPGQPSAFVAVPMLLLVRLFLIKLWMLVPQPQGFVEFPSFPQPSELTWTISVLIIEQRKIGLCHSCVPLSLLVESPSETTTGSCLLHSVDSSLLPLSFLSLVFCCSLSFLVNHWHTPKFACVTLSLYAIVGFLICLCWKSIARVNGSDFVNFMWHTCVL